ncbi:hypothetical protein D3C76_1141440 [compost metagenome]
MATIRRRIQFVEFIVLVALDPFLWIVAVEKHLGRLSGELQAQLEAQECHVQALCKLHCQVEHSLWRTFTHQLMEMLVIPEKHLSHPRWWDPNFLYTGQL